MLQYGQDIFCLGDLGVVGRLASPHLIKGAILLLELAARLCCWTRLASILGDVTGWRHGKLGVEPARCVVVVGCLALFHVHE